MFTFEQNLVKSCSWNALPWPRTRRLTNSLWRLVQPFLESHRLTKSKKKICVHVSPTSHLAPIDLIWTKFGTVGVLPILINCVKWHADWWSTVRSVKIKFPTFPCEIRDVRTRTIEQNVVTAKRPKSVFSHEIYLINIIISASMASSSRSTYQKVSSARLGKVEHCWTWARNKAVHCTTASASVHA